MAGSGEARHIDADLAHDDVSHRVADAGNGDQQIGSLAKGAKGLPNTRLHVAHRQFEALFGLEETRRCLNSVL